MKDRIGTERLNDEVNLEMPAPLKCETLFSSDLRTFPDRRELIETGHQRRGPLEIIAASLRTRDFRTSKIKYKTYAFFWFLKR